MPKFLGKFRYPWYHTSADMNTAPRNHPGQEALVNNRTPLILQNNYDSFSVPPRPGDPLSFSKEDSRRWYDYEYAHWRIEKAPMPESPMDGPEGKRVICNLPMTHPYQLAFRKGLQRLADLHDIQLEVYDTDWDRGAQDHFVDLALDKNPDLIIHVMPQFNESRGIYRKIHSRGIPVMASNMMPAEEDLPYILSWTGPDDWGMSRALAGKFAEFMNYEGGYGLIQHYEDTSCNYARTWGIITELKKIAPAMTCLDYRSTNLNEEESRRTVEQWLRRFGKEMKGIVSADSLVVQKGVNRALAEKRRDDVICVGHWSPPQALQFIRRGLLRATTYQSGIIDGTFSMQTAVDWFNGFEIPPVRYMPVHIITRKDVDTFINKKNEFPSLDYNIYTEALKLGDSEGISQYFDDLYRQIDECSLITIDYCRGVSIEIVSRLISIVAEKGMNRSGILGSANPAMLANNLFHQKSFVRTLEWLEKISLECCSALKSEMPSRSPIEKIVEYVKTHSEEPLSLKVLSYRFNLSAAYLGQIFRKETGRSFSSYLNEIRIERAKKLLENHQLKEYEVARETGYSDASYFYRIFKKQTGMNPSEYREQLTGPPDIQEQP